MKRSILTRLKSAYGELWRTGQSVPGSTRLTGWLPGASGEVDYATEAGDLWLNGAVGVCIQWLARNFGEPPLYVAEEAEEEKPEPVPNHPLTELLKTHGVGEDPDRNNTGVVISLCVNGNAYLWKRRKNAGQVFGLSYLPHVNVMPQVEYDPLPRITSYQVSSGIGSWQVLPADMIHIRNGVDPRQPWLGLSPLACVLREIVTDNQAANYSGAILRHFGVPTLVYAPANGEVWVDGEADRFAEEVRANHTRENSGRSMVARGPLNVQKVGFTPDELAIERIRDVPESRIAAALGVHAMTVGLSVGARQRTYANQAETERHSQLNGLVPLQKIYSRALTRQLLVPDFAGTPTQMVTWDWSTVASLQEDQDKTWARANAAYTGGILELDEARAMVGYEPSKALNEMVELGRQGAQQALESDTQDDEPVDDEAASEEEAAAKGFRLARGWY